MTPSASARPTDSLSTKASGLPLRGLLFVCVLLLSACGGCKGRGDTDGQPAPTPGSGPPSAAGAAASRAGDGGNLATSSALADGGGLDGGPEDGGLAANAAAADAGTPEGIPAKERAAIAADLAFVSERHGKPAVYFIRPDGTQERKLETRGVASFPAAVTRDGRSLVVVRVDEEGDAHAEQLEVYPLPKGKPRTLGPAASRTRHPSLTPDGRFVVFESSANSFADIYRVGLDGKGLKRLTTSETGNFEPNVSPDGKQVAFVSSRDGDSEVYKMGLDGSNPVRLTAFHLEDWAPKWSPKGNRLVFLSTREGTDRLFVMNADGTEVQRVNPNPAPVKMTGNVEESWERDVSWSPDGKRLVYVARVPGQKARLWHKDLDSGENLPLTDGTYSAEGPAFSPDGKYLAFVSDQGGDTELWLMRPDGSGKVAVTRSPGPDWLPLWVPHGKGAKAKARAAPTPKSPPTPGAR